MSNEMNDLISVERQKRKARLKGVFLGYLQLFVTVVM
jgi:hypothetical protein